MAQYRITTDSEEIKEWVEKHQGSPAVIGEGEDLMVRIDFPGKEDEKDLSRTRKSKETSWEKFFKVFEDRDLAFIYYPDRDINDPTFSYRFIKRQNQDELEDDGKQKDNFKNPDAIETLPNSDPEMHIGEAKEFNLGAVEENETLENAPSPEIKSEQAVSGHMSDPASDDDTTANARDMGLLLEDDPQAKTGK